MVIFENSNFEILAEATLMAGLKNAFYHRINSLRRTEEPIITKKSPVGSIMMNERGEVKALGKGTVKAGPTKLLVWNKFDQSVRFLSSDNEKVISTNFTESNYPLFDVIFRNSKF